MRFIFLLLRSSFNKSLLNGSFLFQPFYEMHFVFLSFVNSCFNCIHHVCSSVCESYTPFKCFSWFSLCFFFHFFDFLYYYYLVYNFDGVWQYVPLPNFFVCVSVGSTWLPYVTWLNWIWLWDFFLLLKKFTEEKRMNCKITH